MNVFSIKFHTSFLCSLLAFGFIGFSRLQAEESPTEDIQPPPKNRLVGHVTQVKRTLGRDNKPSFWLKVRLLERGTAYVGESTEVLRPQSKSEALKLRIGFARIVQISELHAILEVTQFNDSPEVKAFFPKRPYPLIGDSIKIYKPVIAHETIILPKLQFMYERIFSDPDRNTHNFELSSKGKVHVKEVLGKHPVLKKQKILIEASTALEGDREENMIESSQRAIAMKHYLLELGFTHENVVALGLGEEGIDVTKFSPRTIARSRQIRITALVE